MRVEYAIEEIWKHMKDAREMAREMESQGISHQKCAEFVAKVDNTYKANLRSCYKNQDELSQQAKWQKPFGYAEDCWDSRAMFYEENYVVEDKAKYIDENWQHWYNPYEDGRDCTGVWFTSYISVFPIPQLGKTIVYHVQNCDV